MPYAMACWRSSEALHIPLTIEQFITGLPECYDKEPHRTEICMPSASTV
jgi:hypothetical protein